MRRVLVTGGTGILGRALTKELTEAGYNVRVMSRKVRPTGASQVEWTQADLLQDEGLEKALSGVEVIIHAAHSPMKDAQKINVEGTRRLLEKAKAEGVAHFIYPSIVGIERVPYAYYRQKVAAERLVEESGVPWTVLRATQFHPFVEMLLLAANRLPVLLLPTDFRLQPLDVEEAARRFVNCVASGPAGRLPDFGGPKVQTLREIAGQWLDARGERKPIIHLPLPGKVAASFRAGAVTAPERSDGAVTWEEWLRRKYAIRQASRSHGAASEKGDR